MATKLMFPLENGLRNIIVINGRVYSSTPGVGISVPDFDAAILEANGWYRGTITSGGASPGPQAANSLFAGPTSGAAAEPAFRPINVNDLNGGTNASGSTAWHGDGTWKAPTVPKTETLKAANYTLAATDHNQRLVATAAITVTAPAVGVLGNGFECQVVNASGGSVVLAGPGATDVTLAAGEIGSVLEANGVQYVVKGGSVVVS